MLGFRSPRLERLLREDDDLCDDELLCALCSAGHRSSRFSVLFLQSLSSNLSNAGCSGGGCLSACVRPYHDVRFTVVFAFMSDGSRFISVSYILKRRHCVLLEMSRRASFPGHGRAFD